MGKISKVYKYYFIYKILNLANKKCYVGFHATNKEYDKDFIEKPPVNKAEVWKKMAENAGITQSQMDKFAKTTSMVERQLMHDYEQKKLPCKLKSKRKHDCDEELEDKISDFDDF